VYQLRTAKGQMGPKCTDGDTVELLIDGGGVVTAIVGGESVVIGSVSE